MNISSGLKWNYAAYAIEGVVGIGLVAFVVRRLGLPEYGIFTLALSITSLLALLDLGLLGLLVPAYTGERERNGASGVSRLLGAATTWLFVAGACAFLVSALIAWTLPGPFALDPDQSKVAGIVMIVIGATAMVWLPSMGIELAYVAAQAFGPLARLQIATLIVRAAATVALISAGGGVIALAWIHLGTAAFRFLTLAVLLPRHARDARLSFSGLDWASLRSLREKRRWSTGDNIARQLAASADSILLGIMVSASSVGIFGVARRIPAHLQAITGKGVDVTLPVLSSQHHKADLAGLQNLFASTIVVTSAALVPVCTLGMIFSSEIIQLLAGPNYASGAPILRWLLLATMTQALSIPAYAVLYATGHVRSAARIGIIEGMANIALTVALIPRFGGTGAAAATAITHLVGTLGWFFPAAMRSAQLRPRELMASLARRARHTLHMINA